MVGLDVVEGVAKVAGHPQGHRPQLGRCVANPLPKLSHEASARRRVGLQVMADLLGLMSTISSLLCCMRPVAKPHASVGERRRVHMPPALHTTLSDPRELSRVIIVGDVHGCLDELNALLGACEYTEERDTVILVGDLASTLCDVYVWCRGTAAAGAARTGRACQSPAHEAQGGSPRAAKANGTPPQCARLGRGSAPERQCA
jgi:hypothetical protein